MVQSQFYRKVNTDELMMMLVDKNVYVYIHLTRKCDIMIFRDELQNYCIGYYFVL